MRHPSGSDYMLSNSSQEYFQKCNFVYCTHSENRTSCYHQGTHFQLTHRGNIEAHTNFKL